MPGGLSTPALLTSTSTPAGKAAATRDANAVTDLEAKTGGWGGGGVWTGTWWMFTHTDCPAQAPRG